MDTLPVPMEAEGPVAVLTKLMTQPARSALKDNEYRTPAWQAAIALRDMETAGIDPRPLLSAHRLALANAPSDWLQKRLRLLWKSSTPSSNLDAASWLHETGRLLCDIPQDILAWAIDEAVKQSERGFMPGVGPIRALAQPKLEDRRQNAERLRQLVEMIERPKVAIPAPAPEPEKIWTQAEVDEANALFVKLGVATRYRLAGGKIETFEAEKADVAVQAQA